MKYLVPTDLYYTKEHEWARLTSDESGDQVVVVGITDYAQAKLGDVVYVILPKVKHYELGEVLAELEAYKGVAEVYSPLSGDLLEVNQSLSESPELINQDPYGKGWIAKIKPTKLSEEIPRLLKSNDYEAMISGP
ncbi:MAG: glycine cleavage system protein GcvH [Thermoprotei archaeon]